jgi:hypothetical protein
MNLFCVQTKIPEPSMPSTMNNCFKDSFSRTQLFARFAHSRMLAAVLFPGMLPACLGGNLPPYFRQAGSLPQRASCPFHPFLKTGSQDFERMFH